MTANRKRQSVNVRVPSPSHQYCTAGYRYCNDTTACNTYCTDAYSTIPRIGPARLEASMRWVDAAAVEAAAGGNEGNPPSGSHAGQPLLQLKPPQVAMSLYVTGSVAAPLKYHALSAER